MITKPDMNKNQCTACGMTLESPAAFHPYLACAAFRHLRNGYTVEGNLKFVIEYGMKAQELGLTAEQALKDISLVK